MKTTYFVKNENTLGFVFEHQPNIFNILAGKPQIGGDDWMDGYKEISNSDKLRIATLEDFEVYRVCSKGHI